MRKTFGITKHRLLLVFQLVVLGLVCLSLGAPAQAEDPRDVLIIANRAVKTDGISPAELKSLFLKKKLSVGGSKIILVNAKKGTALRRLFQTKILGMSPDDESEYWQDQKIKKGITPAIEFADPFKAVLSIRGGIGYCYRSQYKEGPVKILRVL